MNFGEDFLAPYKGRHSFRRPEFVLNKHSKINRAKQLSSFEAGVDLTRIL